jgi:hypothetical protein
MSERRFQIKNNGTRESLPYGSNILPRGLYFSPISMANFLGVSGEVTLEEAITSLYIRRLENNKLPSSDALNDGKAAVS